MASDIGIAVAGSRGFWLLPLSVAAPLYVAILALSLWFYHFIRRAMRQPAMTGREGIMQVTGDVIEVRKRQVRVRVRNETWYAESPDKLRTGDRIRIVGVNGLTLRVQRMDVDRQAMVTSDDSG